MVNVKVSYTDLDGNGRSVWRAYNFAIPQSSSWNYQCLDLHGKVHGDSYLMSKANLGAAIFIETIKLNRQNNADIFIDEMYIWRQAVNGRHVMYFNI